MEFNRILYGEIKFVPHTTTKTITTNNITSNNILNHNGTLSNNHNKPQTATATTTIAKTNGFSNGFSKNTPLPSKVATNSNNDNNNEVGTFREPKQLLSDPNLVKLNWPQSEKIGGGLINVGNTCFLNSVLQCLTYCPPLYNYLIRHNGGHSQACKLSQFCMLCEMEKHIKRIKGSNGTPVKPMSIVQRLRFINKSFQWGRQEDAHEFLRYLIDHMWKACLMNLDINVKNNNVGDKIDARIKETTAINHIFGGYHRSQVLCLSCNSKSNTFDFFMDFILDIRNSKSLEDSMKKFTQPETLEQDNAYKCIKCKKKVTARKRFSVYKAPNVATFQLKRFDSDRIFGGKVTKYVSYPEELDLRPYMSEWTNSPILYQLGAVLVHVGHSSNSGHYFCFVRNSNGFWYRMDDSNVTVVNKSIVLQQQAYILFYTKKTTIDTKQQSLQNGLIDPSKKSNSVDVGIKLPRILQSNGTSYNKIGDNIPNSKVQNGTSPMKSNSQDDQGESHFNRSPQKQTNNQQNLTESTNQTKQTNGGNDDASESGVTSNGVDSAKAPMTSLTTWLGMKSKLDDEDPGKRKLIEQTERDRFNDELDQGKLKKIKSQTRDDRFNNLSKANPFQKFNGSNGYQKLTGMNGKQTDNHRKFFQHKTDRHHSGDNPKSGGFQRHGHNGKQSKFRRHNHQHKHKFNNHHGKHKNRHFNRK